MYNGWYQDICQKCKRTGGLDTSNKNIQLGYRNRIWYWKMCHADNEKWEKRNNRRNRTAKLGNRNSEDKWTKEQVMTMHKFLNPRDDINRLYMSRKKGKRGLNCIEDHVDTSIQGHQEYMKKIKERLIRAASNSNGNIMTNRKTTKTSK